MRLVLGVSLGFKSRAKLSKKCCINVISLQEECISSADDLISKLAIFISRVATPMKIVEVSF